MSRHLHPRPTRRALALASVVCAATVLVTVSGSLASADDKADKQAGQQTGQQSGQQPPLSDGQLVVKLAPGASVASINQLLGSTTESVLLASRGIYLLRVPVDESDRAKKGSSWPAQADRLVHLLEHDRRVVFAEPNSSADSTEGERFHYWPNGGPSCLGDTAESYLGQPAAQRLSLDRVHTRATGGGRTIAVLDTGINPTHPALAGRIAPGGYDYITDTANPSDVGSGKDADGDGRVDEGVGHGTFVAAVAALVAPQARILPLRVLDSEGRGNLFVVAEAVFDATTRGADVINMSFGTPGKPTSSVLIDAISTATRAGVVVVGAAGNDGSTIAHSPASIPGVIAVAAATATNDQLAGFSAHGGWVDVAAPGVDVVSALPCGYGRWSGTSMAAPFVSGEVALVRQLLPRASSDEVAHRVADNATKVHGLDVHSGVIDIWRAVSRP